MSLKQNKSFPNRSVLPYDQRIIDNHIYARFINPKRASTSSFIESIWKPRVLGPNSGPAQPEKLNVQSDPDIIKFQFPPKILSDTKQIKWTPHYQASYEPIVVFMGSEARSIKMKFEYMIYGEWGGTEIYNQINNIKAHAYFGVVGGIGGAKSRDNMAQRGINLPFLQLIAYQIIPKGTTDAKSLSVEKSTWRIINTSITYSPEMCNDDGQSWPIHTEVNLDLQMITQNRLAQENINTTPDGEPINNRTTEDHWSKLSNTQIPLNPQGIWY